MVSWYIWCLFAFSIKQRPSTTWVTCIAWVALLPKVGLSDIGHVALIWRQCCGCFPQPKLHLHTFAIFGSQELCYTQVFFFIATHIESLRFSLSKRFTCSEYSLKPTKNITKRYTKKDFNISKAHKKDKTFASWGGKNKSYIIAAVSRDHIIITISKIFYNL